MSLKKMNVHRLWIVAVLFGLVMSVALVVPTASADSHVFNISIYHGINGRSLGLDKDLPVDIYVNNALPEFLKGVEFKDRLETQLLSGTYTFDVKLAGTDTTVMSFGPAEIPAGVDVSVHAKLGADKTPTLKVNVK
jgi:hypothetical protein